LVFVAFLKLLVVISALSYWRTCEQGGLCLDQLKYIQSFLFAISETAFFCSLLLIAKGWRITRSRLPSSEIRTISVALILLLSTLLFFSFYNDGYYFLSLMIMYFFMLPKIFTSITRNSRALETQLVMVNRSNLTEQEIDGVHKKIRLYRMLRSSVIMYLGSILVVNSLRIVMVWYLDWFNYLLNEVVVFLMMYIICFILRPSNTALFSTATMFDVGNLYPLFNVDDFFSDTEFGIVPSTQEPPIDPSEYVVIEYPYRRKNGQKPTPATVPISLGILDKPSEEEETPKSVEE